MSTQLIQQWRADLFFSGPTRWFSVSLWWYRPKIFAPQRRRGSQSLTEHSQIVAPLIQRIARQLAVLIGPIVIAGFFGFLAPASAQILKVEIRLLPDSNRAAIDASCGPASAWSFRDSYAG